MEIAYKIVAFFAKSYPSAQTGKLASMLTFFLFPRSKHTGTNLKLLVQRTTLHLTGKLGQSINPHCLLAENGQSIETGAPKTKKIAPKYQDSLY